MRTDGSDAAANCCRRARQKQVAVGIVVDVVTGGIEAEVEVR